MTNIGEGLELGAIAVAPEFARVVLLVELGDQLAGDRRRRRQPPRRPPPRRHQVRADRTAACSRPADCHMVKPL